MQRALSFARLLTSSLVLSASGGCHDAGPAPGSTTPVAAPAPTTLPKAAQPDAPNPVPGSTPVATPSRSAPWWEIPYPERFSVSSLGEQLPLVSVKGNQFVDPAGKTVVLQGVSIADPDKVERTGHWNRKHFEVIQSWGANVVRIPVHPAAWRGRGQAEYLKLLDQAVLWATELQLYVIVDWHSIGNLVTGLVQHPMYETTLTETLEFWRTISFRYQGVTTIVGYEIFNEPTVFNGNLGAATWAQWKIINEEAISIIRSHDKQAVPLVAGFDWAYELRSVKQAPIDRTGVAYVSHPYPQKTDAPFEAHWDEDFGYVKEKHPLILTEIGYMRPEEPEAHVPVRDDGSYGPRITDYAKKRGISWVAWCFDPDWAPPLISDWDYTPTESGAHFRKVMLERRALER